MTQRPDISPAEPKWNLVGPGLVVAATGVGATGSVGSTFNRWRPNSGIDSGVIGE